MDINRNALRRDPEETEPDQIERMNRFWGDNSWRETGYIPSNQMTPFGDLEKEKVTNEVFAEEFRRRLERIAGFRYVPKPIPMRNSRNAIVYYLFFAAHKPAAANIVIDIFKKYADRRS
jgi:three-Cys-motif partner protein